VLGAGRAMSPTEPLGGSPGRFIAGYRSVVPLTGVCLRRAERIEGRCRDAAGMVKERRERPETLIRQLTAEGRHGRPGDAAPDLQEDLRGIVSSAGGQQVRRRWRQPLHEGGEARGPMTLDAVLPK
jgi:hypothetical protein